MVCYSMRTFANPLTAVLLFISGAWGGLNPEVDVEADSVIMGVIWFCGVCGPMAGCWRSKVYFACWLVCNPEIDSLYGEKAKLLP